MISGSDDMHNLKPIPRDAISRWQAEEQELEYQLMGRMTQFLPESDLPVIDSEEPFAIRWRGCPCRLGDNDSFKLMKLLIEARNGMVSRQSIMQAVGDDELSDVALRKAVSRLKGRLKASRMDELAERIKTADAGEWVVMKAPDLFKRKDV
jgi:hypothetical protein